jgi:hypothetical protein
VQDGVFDGTRRADDGERRLTTKENGAFLFYMTKKL